MEQAKLEFNKEHPSYATSLSNAALLYNNQGLHAEAEPLYIEVKNIYEKVLGINYISKPHSKL